MKIEVSQASSTEEVIENIRAKGIVQTAANWISSKKNGAVMLPVQLRQIYSYKLLCGILIHTAFLTFSSRLEVQDTYKLSCHIQADG